MAENLTGINNAEQVLSGLNKNHYFTGYTRKAQIGRGVPHCKIRRFPEHRIKKIPPCPPGVSVPQLFHISTFDIRIWLRPEAAPGNLWFQCRFLV